MSKESKSTNKNQVKNKKTMLKTVKDMAKESGLGESFLRTLMDSRQLSYVQIGKKRLIAEEAIWDWYNRNKITPTGGMEYGDCR